MIIATYAWCLRCNIFSTLFLDIRTYQLVIASTSDLQSSTAIANQLATWPVAIG